MTPHPPLTGASLAISSIALALATFMQVLDTTIVVVAIPTIAGNLGVSADQGTWVVTSFAISNGVSVPLTGWLMQRYGVVRTFVASVLLFTFASFLCGISWSLTSLVVFRVLQGAVSGPMIPGSQALLMSIFPADRRASALAIWSMTTLVAPITGPILGGYISDTYAWPWIFFINIPVGLLCAFLSWRGLAQRETPTRKIPVDRTGLALLVVWVGALQVMLDTGKDADWFASPSIVILALVAGIGFLVWLIWENTDQHPIVDLSLFANRNFALGTLALCLGYAVFFGNIVILPLWLQTQMNYTATWSGLVVAPSGFVAVVVTATLARHTSKMDARLIGSFAFVAFGCSYFMRAGLTPDASFGALVMPMLVQGIAMSLFFVSMITLSLHGVPPARVPLASGLSNFCRITAGSFSASITTTLWDRREALHQSRLTEGMSPYDQVLVQTSASLHSAGLNLPEGLAVITRALVSQAYAMASLDFFWLSAWLSLALIPVVWLARRATAN
jgi:DHA2 family multidrug resistance protein